MNHHLRFIAIVNYLSNKNSCNACQVHQTHCPGLTKSSQARNPIKERLQKDVGIMSCEPPF
jgi:hypothetical protein